MAIERACECRAQQTDLPWALSPNMRTAHRGQSLMIVWYFRPERRCCCSLARAAEENKVNPGGRFRGSRATDDDDDHWGSRSETPSARSLFTAVPLSQKFHSRCAIGGRWVTWRMLAASSVKIPGQESGADGGDKMIEECFLTIGGREKSAKVLEFYICTDDFMRNILDGKFCHIKWKCSNVITWLCVGITLHSRDNSICPLYWYRYMTCLWRLFLKYMINMKWLFCLVGAMESHSVLLAEAGSSGRLPRLLSY